MSRPRRPRPRRGADDVIDAEVLPADRSPGEAADGGADGEEPPDDGEEPGVEPDARDLEEAEAPDVAVPELATEAELTAGPSAELAQDAGAHGEAGAPAPRPASGRSLVRHDPLTAYVQELRRYPLLSRDEEHALAARYFQEGDVAAARTLITANLRLVVKIAHEYRRAYRNLLDLIQEGNIGLMQAVRKYDPYRGVKLSSYAAWWIRAYMIKFILNNWRLVKIGTTQAQRKLFFNLKKERDKLERLGFDVGTKLLAERLEVTEKEVDEMERRLAAPDFSLDAPISRDESDGRTHLDAVTAPASTRPDRSAEDAEFRALLRAKLQRFAERLKGRERTIFDERLLAEQPLTLQEIGEKYGVSRERARQLEKRLVDKLRIYLREELGEAVEIAPGSDE